MKYSAIEPNVTIVDVVPTLTNPKEYVRAIVSTMSPCHQKHGNASVRIGITGEGKMPSHKVSFVGTDGKDELFGAYSRHGRSRLARHARPLEGRGCSAAVFGGAHYSFSLYCPSGCTRRLLMV